ncbi:hypothetical protein TNCV_2282821 [Trichonephila clavipes]|nr:hypothetical protein TNCV_2282821 [Trichonephila clavipes]
MINTKKKERFPPEPGTIVSRQKDINLITGKPFRIKICCTSQILINSLREDTEYLLDLGVNGMGQSNRTLPVVWVGSEVRPTKGELEPWESLFRLHNVDLVNSLHLLMRIPDQHLGPKLRDPPLRFLKRPALVFFELFLFPSISPFFG